mgnify:CR=1 FL=1
MLTHFTYNPFIAKDTHRREYLFSFYYKGTYYSGVYHYNGAIDWQPEPNEEDRAMLTSRIHELMLFHVYDT